MNILTKICVVLLMLVSVVASVTFVIYAREKPSWKYFYQQEREAKKVVASKYISLMEEVRNLQNRLIDEREVRSTMQNKLQNRIDELDAENKEVRHKNMTLTNQFQSIDQELKAQQAEIKSQNEQIKSLNTRLEEAYKEEYALRERNTELTRKLEEQKARGDRLEKSLGVVRNQTLNQKKTIDEMTTRVVELKRQLAKFGGAEEKEAPTSRDQITGTVVAVGSDIASINVGSANGVKKDMVFVIYRGSEYVGKLQIKRVQVSESAGVLTFKKLTPMQGDRVINRLDLGSGV